MDVEVRQRTDEYESMFETLFVNDVFQGKVGPVDPENNQQISCTMMMTLLEQAYDAGKRQEPFTITHVYEDKDDADLHNL